VIGLTGGIGTGKSTVARIFEQLGAVVIDADAIVHELQAPGMPMLAEIAAAFGPELIRPDGSLDRPRLGDIVFRDPEARRRLGQIVHPAVGAEMLRRLAAAREARARLVVLDIPLLFEGRKAGSGSAALLAFDATVLVYARERQQVERQVARDGHEADEALRRVRSQLPIEEKRALADYVIDNSGSLADTERQVRELYERLVGG
jgi:dephospho-CoA kinase